MTLSRLIAGVAALAAAACWGAPQADAPPAGDDATPPPDQPPAAEGPTMTPALAAAFAVPTDYVIGETDVLRVRIIGDTELTGNYTVRLDGKIDFPYLGEIQAAGLGLADFNRRLRDGLASFYHKPQVNVEVAEYNSCVVYVLGEVEKPGVYKFAARTSLLEMVAAAGGYKRTASRASTMVVRAFPAAPEVMRVDMEKVIDGGAITLNVPLRKGDVVVVPKTFITNLNQFLVDISPSLSAYLMAHTVYMTDWDRSTTR